MLSEIIKKYELEGRKRLSESRGTKGSDAGGFSGTITGDSTTSVWTVKPPDDVPSLAQAVGAQPIVNTASGDMMMTEVMSFDMHNKMVEFYETVKKAAMLLAEMENSSQIVRELERLRSENTNLKQQVRDLEKR